MLRNLYVATMEARSGKSAVVLGIMEMLSRRTGKVGFFRPVIRAGESPDNDISLILGRYKLGLDYEDLYAHTHEEARAMVVEGRYDVLLKGILSKYKELESRCDFVLCEGTDLTGVSSAFEFDFNALVANHLGCQVVAVVNGREKSADELVAAVHASRQAFTGEGCAVLAIMVNRVDPGEMDSLRETLRATEGGEFIYLLPEDPELARLTVGAISRALGGRCVHGQPEDLNRAVRDYKVAAMHLPNFLDHVEDGTLVITSGDRADVILGSLASVFSENYPNIAGLVLTGGLVPEPPVMRLIEGLRKAPIAVVTVETDTYTTAARVGSIHTAIAPNDERRIASALGLFESHVDTAELEERIALVRSTRVTPMMFEYELIERAKSDRQHIVLPEGGEERILRAAEILLKRGVVDITLLGDEEEIAKKIADLGLHLEGAGIVDPASSELHRDFARTYFELRKHKGISEAMAGDAMTDVSYFGTMMVHAGMVGGMVSGAVHTTQHTIRPSFEIIRLHPDYTIVSSVFFMCLDDRVLVYGDCAVNPDPSAEELADIAIGSAATAAMFAVEPRVAMLSYSTGESGKGADVDKVREATRIARERRPDLKIEGPIQYDAAVDTGVARTKLPESEVAGRATVFIFPDLNTGNNTYKAVQRSAGAVAVGPVLQGLEKPVNDLSRGCTVTDIVNTVAITAIQAQAVGSRS